MRALMSSSLPDADDAVPEREGMKAFLLVYTRRYGMAKEDAGEKLSKIRHSMAHVMAEAVLQMFPTAQITIGPAIDNGFYYDFDLPRQLVNEDLEEITARMRRSSPRASRLSVGW